MVRTTAAEIKRLRVGDVLFVLPAHSCLTVNLWDHFVKLGGERVSTIRANSI